VGFLKWDSRNEFLEMWCWQSNFSDKGPLVTKYEISAEGLITADTEGEEQQ
jgi:hypothetical protein